MCGGAVCTNPRASGSLLQLRLPRRSVHTQRRWRKGGGCSPHEITPHHVSGMPPLAYSCAMLIRGPCAGWGLEINMASRVVRREGEESRLTPIEFKLLGVLLRHPGRLLTHTTL